MLFNIKLRVLEIAHEKNGAVYHNKTIVGSRVALETVAILNSVNRCKGANRRMSAFQVYQWLFPLSQSWRIQIFGLFLAKMSS